MSQLAFDLDALLPPVPKSAAMTYECGEHVQHREWEAHLAHCWGGACPACGQEMFGWFDFHTNHGVAHRPAWDVGLCSKQHLLLNHMARISQLLDAGETTTNCFAFAHRGQHKGNGYFGKGAPVECMVAEYGEKRAWLTSHRIAEGDLPEPRTDAARTILGLPVGVPA